MSFVSTLELSRRKKPHELKFFYLWLIRLDFIDGLVLELESQKFQHFFAEKSLAEKLDGGNKDGFPRVPVASSWRRSGPTRKEKEEFKKTIGIKARRYNQYTFQIYALSNSSFTLSKSSKLIEIHFLRSSSDHQNNSITSLLGFDVKFYFFLAFRQKTENLLSTDIFEPTNWRTDNTTQFEIVNASNPSSHLRFTIASFAIAWL